MPERRLLGIVLLIIGTIVAAGFILDSVDRYTLVAISATLLVAFGLSREYGYAVPAGITGGLGTAVLIISAGTFGPTATPAVLFLSIAGGFTAVWILGLLAVPHRSQYRGRSSRLILGSVGLAFASRSARRHQLDPGGVAAAIVIAGAASCSVTTRPPDSTVHRAIEPERTHAMSPSIRRPRPLLFAALAVSLAAAACGGGGVSDASTPDPATPAPTAVASSDATATPAPTRPAISGAPALIVRLDTQDESKVRVAVIDQTGLLTGITSEMPGDGASVPVDAPTVVDADAASLVVTWSAPPCDSEPTVVLSETRLLIVQPPCPDPSDAVAFDRILILRFRDTVEAASLEVVLQDAF